MFPEIQEIIEKIRTQLGCRKIHLIRLTDELNASIARKFSLRYGSTMNCLNIGLSYVAFLSRKQGKLSEAEAWERVQLVALFGPKKAYWNALKDLLW